MLYSILNSGGKIDFLQIIMRILAVTVTMIVILPFHELAHGFIANKLGDNTAKRMGRLTFNPAAHLDPMGALCLFLVGFGWAKPVPVNMRKLKNPKRDMALVALAGPVANLIAALVGALLGNLFIVLLGRSFGSTMWFNAIEMFFEYYISVNVGLAVFNLIPLPPLDGSKILGAFLPDDIYEKQLMIEDKLSIVLMILIILGGIEKILYYPNYYALKGVLYIAALPFRAFAGGA